ncbi:MAG: hypothetical protein MZW92_05695 [Comamonadaceae bacterium]|nr:hypothetical protein [Comamonadaceae bacterium]
MLTAMTRTQGDAPCLSCSPSRARRASSASRAGRYNRGSRAASLAAFDGMVSTEDLLRLYPDTKLEEDGGFERVTRIKEDVVRAARARAHAAEPGRAGAAPVPRRARSWPTCSATCSATTRW